MGGGGSFFKTDVKVGFIEAHCDAITTGSV